MANMSYCMFRNTLPDFSDCRDRLEQLCSLEELSREEEQAAREMVAEAKKLIAAFESIDD